MVPWGCNWLLHNHKTPLSRTGILFGVPNSNNHEESLGCVPVTSRGITRRHKTLQGFLVMQNRILGALLDFRHCVCQEKRGLCFRIQKPEMIEGSGFREYGGSSARPSVYSSASQETETRVPMSGNIGKLNHRPVGWKYAAMSYITRLKLPAFSGG